MTEEHPKSQAKATPPEPSSNDNRSNVMNPNNSTHKAAANNRSNQMNPNNPAFRRSRGRK